MKSCTLFIIFIFLFSQTKAQNGKKIQKSWIKTSIEDLSGKISDADTLYTRYDFGKSTLNISFYPGWNTYEQSWSTNGNHIKVGFDTYNIEELTDTSFTIALEGFKRIKLLAEDYLSNQEVYLDSIGNFNNNTLYKANNFITPRYTGKNDFRTFIQSAGEGKYSIKKANYFLVTFVITETGELQNIKIIKGIFEGFNNEIIKQLNKTSKKWRPAYFRGKPIQTEMFYEIRYLNSPVPYNSGTI